MAISSWLKHLFQHAVRKGRVYSRRQACRRKRQGVCLQVERLEDRTVPAAVGVPSGILSWWAGDDSAADLAGPNAGTLNNGVSFAQGEVADGFTFNGSNYVSAGTSGLSIRGSDRTMELWVKIDAFG